MRRKKQDATASPVAAKEISVDSSGALVLSELEMIFALNK